MTSDELKLVRGILGAIVYLGVYSVWGVYGCGVLILCVVSVSVVATIVLLTLNAYAK